MAKNNKMYITTRLVRSKAKKAFENGAKTAMDLNGYIVVENDGWIVRKYKDGRTQQIKELADIQLPGGLKLDK